MAAPRITRPPEEVSKRRKVIYLLAASVTLLFAMIVSQTSFDLNFLNPDSNQQIAVFAGLSALVFLLFVALTFVLARNLFKLFAERRLGVLGSKFRTRIVVAGLLLSFLPVIFMFWFAYGLMNRSIDKWFSRPVEEVREDTNAMAGLLSDYAAQNAQVEAISIASSPETQYAFEGHSFSAVATEFHKHEPTLQGGFVVALLDGNAEASFGAPSPWPLMKGALPSPVVPENPPVRLSWQHTDYVLASARVGKNGIVLVGMPLPDKFSATMRQLERSQQRYFNLAKSRKQVRRTYMILLLLLTVLVLFTTMWLALYLSKLVNAADCGFGGSHAGNLPRTISITGLRSPPQTKSVTWCAPSIAWLRSSNRAAIRSKTPVVNSPMPTPVSSNAVSTWRPSWRVFRLVCCRWIPIGGLPTQITPCCVLFRPKGGDEGTKVLTGAALADVFPREVIEDMEPLMRRADRMGTTTTQLEMTLPSSELNVAVTIATLRHRGQGLGYVLVFEDLSDVLKAQKQAAWREVARRVAHENQKSFDADCSFC